jgi:hypothetical protein
MSTNPIMQRWEAFLSKISDRYLEILGEAEAGFRALAEENPEDDRSLNNAVTAIRSRLLQLEQKIDDTMSDKISESLSGALLDRAIARMEQTRLSLAERWERIRVKALGDFYRSMAPRVEAESTAPRQCTQCGGALPAERLIKPRSVKCDFCGSVNQVTPAAIVASYYASAPNSLAEEATLEQRLAIERKEQGINQRRAPASGAELQALEKMEREYWERYVEVRGRIQPQTPEDRARFVESRMEVWKHAHRS